MSWQPIDAYAAHGAAPAAEGPAMTVARALAEGAVALNAAGVPEGRLDARLLLAHVAGLGRESQVVEPGRVLGPATVRAFAACIARRAAREPLSRIVGRREFWSLELALGPECFDPRPDSETLVAAVLDEIADREAALTVLDLGTGSGCLLLALLSELPNARGLGIDASEGAARVARGNAATLGLGRRACFAVDDWGAAVAAAFDVVVCNPPYIPSAEIAGLTPEVARHEPRVALDGGADGLDCYRTLAPELARLLKPGGLAALEVGAGQAADVTKILRRARISVHRLRRDLAGVARCLVAAAT